MTAIQLHPSAIRTVVWLVLVLTALPTAAEAQLATTVDRQTKNKKPNGRPLEEVNGPDCLCGTFTDPVCGRDGETYSNACWARCAGLTQGDWRVGACGKKPPPGGNNSGVSCGHVRLCEHIFEPANVGGGRMACGWCHVGSEPENGHAIACAHGSHVCDPVEACVGEFFDITTTCPSSSETGTLLPLATPTPTPTTFLTDASLEYTATPGATPTPTADSVTTPSATVQVTQTLEPTTGVKINAGQEATRNATKPSIVSDADGMNEAPTTRDATLGGEVSTTVDDREEREVAPVGVWSDRTGHVIASGSAPLADCEYCAGNETAPLVCGSDGVTYLNQCEASCKGVALRRVGPCSFVEGTDAAPPRSHLQAACMAFCRFSQSGVSQRVCGEDGRTLGSSCEAACLGVTVKAWQPCECGCATEGRVVSEGGRLLDVQSGCRNGGKEGRNFCFTAGECAGEVARRIPIFRAQSRQAAAVEDALFSKACQPSNGNPEPSSVAASSAQARIGRKGLKQQP